MDSTPTGRFSNHKNHPIGQLRKEYAIMTTPLQCKMRHTRTMVSYTLFLGSRPSQLPHEGILDTLGPLELLISALVDLHVGHGLATGQLG